MKHIRKQVIIFAVLFLLIQCGQDLVEEGTQAFNQGDYTTSIKLLTQAQDEDSTLHHFDEMIFLAYLYRGAELFDKTRNVRAFAGNFEKANEYMPDKPSESFSQNYSEMLISLANAYLQVKTSSETEEEEYFQKAVNTARKAKQIDSTNTVADSLLAKLKLDHFQNLIDKGISLYNRAGRTRNPDLYFTARYYFLQAQEFEADNNQILDYLSRIKSRTFSVLDYREGVSIAVAGFKQERKATIVNLSIKNYTAKPVKINLENFALVDENGNRYGFSEREMQKRELFGDTVIKNTILNRENPSTSGVVAFDAPPKVKIAYVNYQIDSKNFARKYFP